VGQPRVILDRSSALERLAAAAAMLAVGLEVTVSCPV
jgi:hypothetical protein